MNEKLTHKIRHASLMIGFYALYVFLITRLIDKKTNRDNIVTTDDGSLT